MYQTDMMLIKEENSKKKKKKSHSQKCISRAYIRVSGKGKKRTWAKAVSLYSCEMYMTFIHRNHSCYTMELNRAGVNGKYKSERFSKCIIVI